ncbi:15-hydroxyprostaglandin dehydrogenase [NAD(+)]-like [Ctenocephalides felis]|uniref:15-hydroxyprostaglandin dehydrogenase [NAD(+)]-like n=1 Tax=Ctenocephalides felis TaxID=7515 RepID=UPI000E6E4703|nr:15-hydroxyprostaglandin dehydrogenase [NAD(+)]-like [Ctenocephalides felis]
MTYFVIADAVSVIVSDLNQLKAAFGFAREKLNNVRIVLNNAAILAESIWEKMIDINVKASILGTKLAAELMAGHDGVIVNTSS